MVQRGFPLPMPDRPYRGAKLIIIYQTWTSLPHIIRTCNQLSGNPCDEDSLPACLLPFPPLPKAGINPIKKQEAA